MALPAIGWCTVQHLRLRESFANKNYLNTTLEFRELCRPHATLLLAPEVVGLLDHANLSDRIHPGHSLPDKYFNLSQLGDKFIRFVSLIRNL